MSEVFEIGDRVGTNRAWLDQGFHYREGRIEGTSRAETYEVRWEGKKSVVTISSKWLRRARDIKSMQTDNGSV